jgi:hypothetical protein
MGVKKLMGMVSIAAGIFRNRKTGDSYESVQEVWRAEAKCGCGIDCCEKELVLEDKTTHDFMSLYFDNGGAFVRNHTTGVVSELTLTPIES